MRLRTIMMMKRMNFRAGLALVVLTATLLLGALMARAAEAAPGATNSPAAASTAGVTNNPEADKAWREVVAASQAPAPPKEWEAKEPTHEEVIQYYAPFAVKAADLAKDFYTRFPEHPEAGAAHEREIRILRMAVTSMGQTNQAARLAALEKDRPKDVVAAAEGEPASADDPAFKLRFQALQQLVDGLPESSEKLEAAARQLVKDFPKRPEPNQILSQVLFILAENAGAEKSRVLLKEVVAGEAPEQIKMEAQSMLDQLEMVGKPVAIRYTAVDGREVDMAKLKGKVVLVDFWATWCGPCVAEVPRIKAAYDKLHAKGFEIVGIDFDPEKEALVKFVAEAKTEWPQYFEAGGEDNKFGKEFGVHMFPTMWLVDKQGVVRDVNGRAGLEEKVTKLLAE